jgi:hypothetical protein
MKYVDTNTTVTVTAGCQVMSDIVDESHWDTKRMREDTHEWVDALVAKCSNVRHYTML